LHSTHILSNSLQECKVSASHPKSPGAECKLYGRHKLLLIACCMMLRSLHRSGTAASPQALWLGVISQLGHDISCVGGCGRSLADQPFGNSPACTLPLPAHLLCQRSLSGLAVHPEDEQTHASGILASDSLPQRTPQPYLGEFVAPASALACTPA
jgi:hypothetical protein